MFPMLEMAGTHSQFISEVLYIYNVATALNDHKLRLTEQFEVDQYVRKKERYLPLPYLITTPPDKDHLEES